MALGALAVCLYLEREDCERPAGFRSGARLRCERSEHELLKERHFATLLLVRVQQGE